MSNRHILEQLGFLLQHEPMPVFIVGGCIREWLLGKESTDIDIVCIGDARLLARKISRYFKSRFIVLDETRAIYRIFIDHKLTVDISKCRSDKIEPDLLERDLSINAMAVSAHQWNALLNRDWGQVDLIDPGGGHADLSDGLVRAISKGNLIADPLRLLRVFRIAAHLNFVIEAQTLKWVTELSSQLEQVPAERIVHELERLFNSPYLVTYLYSMHRCQLLQTTMGWHSLDNDSQVIALEWIKWVFHQHEKSYQKISPEWASALKNYMSESVSGKHTIYITLLLGICCLVVSGQNSKKIAQWCERLRLSNRDKILIQMMGQGQYLFDVLVTSGSVTRTDQLKWHQIYGEHLPVVLLSSCGFWQVKEKKMGLPYQPLWTALLESCFASKGLAHMIPLINGYDVMTELNLKSGPVIKTLLQGVYEAQAEGHLHTREDALKWVKKLWLANDGQ